MERNIFKLEQEQLKEIALTLQKKVEEGLAKDNRKIDFISEGFAIVIEKYLYAHDTDDLLVLSNIRKDSICYDCKYQNNLVDSYIHITGIH